MRWRRVASSLRRLSAAALARRADEFFISRLIDLSAHKTPFDPFAFADDHATAAAAASRESEGASGKRCSRCAQISSPQSSAVGAVAFADA